MIQAVHDVAPGANLAFATAELRATPPSPDNIRALATAGADVIADDFIYFNEPFYQDSVISKAVSDVTAQGYPYFSMAFNNNRVIAGNDSNSWEAPAYRSDYLPFLSFTTRHHRARMTAWTSIRVPASTPVRD